MKQIEKGIQEDLKRDGEIGSVKDFERGVYFAVNDATRPIDGKESRWNQKLGRQIPFFKPTAQERPN